MKTVKIKGLSRLFMVLVTAFTFASCSNDDNNTEFPKAPVVLVHGAWQGDYIWNQTKSDLIAAGYRVSVVKLPGHGDNNTPAHQISFQDYVNQVTNAINAYDEPVILVGHSLGGAVITQTASQLPQKISKLVYIAGFIPKSGKSVLDYSLMDTNSLLGPSLQLSEDQTLAGIVDPETNLTNIFCQDGTIAQKQFLVERYKAEPTIPLATPLNYTIADYNEAGEKYYIYTTSDQTITYPFQQQMAADADITNTYTINSGHSPFISKSEKLTSILKGIFKK